MEDDVFNDSLLFISDTFSSAGFFPLDRLLCPVDFLFDFALLLEISVLFSDIFSIKNKTENCLEMRNLVEKRYEKIKEN